ncbi:putative ORAOV1 family protein [Spathaspora sp. JA1]|nr:putative ORAOV1 family protein [Spathaspora sp. JA1]
MSDLNIDTEEILNPEEESYKQGYREGQQQSTNEQYVEGKQFGLQTGFQRFLIVGYIQGLVDQWKKRLGQYEGNVTALESHLRQLEDLISGIPDGNSDTEVAEYESRLTKARNKVRVISTLTKDNSNINSLDDLIKSVGGQLTTSENVDEMW